LGAQYVQVAVSAPIRNLFTYSVSGELELGTLVEVPFGKGVKRGVVVEFQDRPAKGMKIKAVKRVVEERPVLSRSMIRTLLWAADYYLAPVGEMIFAALPPPMRKKGKAAGEKSVLVAAAGESAGEEQVLELVGRAPLQARVLKHLIGSGEADVPELEREVPGARAALRALEKKGLVEIKKSIRSRRPRVAELPEPETITRLTDGQEAALQALGEALDRGGYQAFLLHGVTGSGKTEVYLQAITHGIERGRGAILLVPEISLTPQLLSRVTARFGRQVAVLHSGLSAGERLDEWRRLQQGEALVAVGARSAVFAPVRKPAILVVDEEHDSSYKQSERLPYSGRDLAMVRAREEGSVVLLGTATPSVESYAHAKSGRSTLLRLDERVQQRTLPRVEVVDLKETLPDPVERVHTIGPYLAECLAETLDRGEQAILFLNRRGYSSFALCKDCGQSVKCENCSVALVHHLKEKRLRCHYCGLSSGVPSLCRHCGGGRIQLFGLGTEKCEEEVRRRFPGARVIRMDSDSTTRRGAVVEMISRFASGQADILVGTQMVTKGHDMPGVTLVGVVLADLGIHLPDFRASERTFQLLMQVAGRAGRGEQPGRVVVQTFLPAHESIVLAKEHRFEEFFEKELSRRQKLGYPPRKRLLLIRASHSDREVVAGLARKVAAAVRRAGDGRLEVLGPVASPLARLRGRYRWQMLVKSSTVKALQEASTAVIQRLKLPGGAKILFDVDPQDML
jgi:primosomal protein N' (replication factor Y)